jgi:hypothetical protein
VGIENVADLIEDVRQALGDVSTAFELTADSADSRR